MATLVYRTTWLAWAALGRRLRPGKRREYYLSFYDPFSLILVLALWAALFILAFAVLHWGLATPLLAPEKVPTFLTYLSMSGTIFVTLGFGDVTPLSQLGRVLAVTECGMGLDAPGSDHRVYSGDLSDLFPSRDPDCVAGCLC